MTSASVSDLAQDVSVGVVLQQHGGGSRVVVSSCDVQRGEADLPFGSVVDQQGHHVLVALLERHRQRREAVLRGEGEG